MVGSVWSPLGVGERRGGGKREGRERRGERGGEKGGEEGGEEGKGRRVDGLRELWVVHPHTEPANLHEEGYEVGGGGLVVFLLFPLAFSDNKINESNIYFLGCLSCLLSRSSAFLRM